MEVVEFNYMSKLTKKRALLDKRTKHHYVSVGTRSPNCWEYRLPIDDRHIGDYGKDLSRVTITPLINIYEKDTQCVDSKGNLIFLLRSGKKSNEKILCISERMDDVVNVKYSVFGNIKLLGAGDSRTIRNNKIEVPAFYITGEGVIKIVRVYDDRMETHTLTFNGKIEFKYSTN